MNVKKHHFSIRLLVSSRTTGKQKCGVSFLHSWLFTLGGFDYLKAGPKNTMVGDLENA